jgi:ribosome maturation factor RimP
MIEREKIEYIIKDLTEKRGIFIVSVQVSASNKITLLVDSMKGIQIQDCAQISRAIESGLEEEQVDFELEVSSPGLDEPFKVKQQYLKNIGREVMVLFKDGKSFKGKLLEADEHGFKVEEAMGKKPKKEVSLATRDFIFSDDIKVKVIIKI